MPTHRPNSSYTTDGIACYMTNSVYSHCQRLTPLQLLTFCQEIANAMDYLSKKGFIHRDLAARNILLNEEYNCKVGTYIYVHFRLL